MKIDVTVLGGAGYLGSVISQCLSGKLEQIGKITVIDCNMYGDQAALPSTIVLKEADLLANPREALGDGGTVIWAIDIDCEAFYALPMSRNYVKHNLKAFECVAKEKENNLILVTDDYWGTNESYKDFLKKKEEIASEHECMVVKVPQLFGPSARMRYDTLLNEMFFSGFVGGVVHAEDWLRRCAVCSVAIAGEYIVENMVLGDVNNAILRNCVLSYADYAGLMMKIFDGKAQLSLSNEKLAIYDYKDEGVVNIPFGRYAIHNSFQYMLNSLEKDGIKDMVADCHNNSKMLLGVGGYSNLVKAIGRFGE